MVPSEVIDTNVLTIASAVDAGWVHPRIPLAERRLVLAVLRWVMKFRDSRDRHLVMDYAQTILAEYKSPRNMPEHGLYGRQVVQHKFDTGAIHFVELTYWNNGSERVACLPEEVEVLIHDLGDRKMVAAAYEAGAILVNACDSDWTNPEEVEALELLGISLVQVLTDEERSHCRSHESD